MSLLITTSWDDGYALDTRVAEILDQNGLKGTFYVCPKPQYGETMLTKEEIRTLSRTHDIGSHTLTHPTLTEIDDASVVRELTGGKAWVEEITGKPCTAFCYPKGAFDARTETLAKKAGFTCARTCETLRFEAPNPYALPVSLQIFPFPWRKSFTPMWKILDPLGPLRVQSPRLRELGIPLSKMTSWLTMAETVLSYAVKTNAPFFHLYGHSREIEKFGMWEQLRSFAKLVGGVNGAKHVTNTELVTALS